MHVVEPIRILQVVTYMGRGGLETMLMNYYRHIDRSQVQFDFLVHRGFIADYDQEIMDLGGRIYRLPRLNPMSVQYQKTLRSFFEKHREYQVVHSHLDCMAGIPLKEAKAHGVPVCIAHAHNNNQTKDGKYLLKLLYKRNIPKFADFLFACSQEAGEWMYGGRPFWILNNAIDAPAYVYDESTRQKARRELGISEDSLLVGHVGRFAPQKNHLMLIKIMASLKNKCRDSKLLLVGTGEGLDSVKAEVRSLGLQNDVIFAGLRTDVPDLLQAMDVFLFPSLFEGLGMAAIEAQAAGLPCIISDGVSTECKKTDLVIQKKLADGPDAWADQIVRLSSKHRQNTLDQVTNAGFNVNVEAQKLQDFYLDCYANLDHKERIHWQQ